MQERLPRFPQVPLEQVAQRAKNAFPMVLSVSRDPLAADMRSAVLRRAGFQVVNAASAGQAAARLKEKNFQAVILGYSLSSAEREVVIRVAREARSAPWIIGLYQISVTDVPGAHVVVDANDGPDALVNTLCRLSRRPEGVRNPPAPDGAD